MDNESFSYSLLGSSTPFPTRFPPLKTGWFWFLSPAAAWEGGAVFCRERPCWPREARVVLQMRKPSWGCMSGLGRTREPGQRSGRLSGAWSTRPCFLMTLQSKPWRKNAHREKLLCFDFLTLAGTSSPCGGWEGEMEMSQGSGCDAFPCQVLPARCLGKAEASCSPR